MRFKADGTEAALIDEQKNCFGIMIWMPKACVQPLQCISSSWTCNASQKSLMVARWSTGAQPAKATRPLDAMIRVPGSVLAMSG